MFMFFKRKLLIEQSFSLEKFLKSTNILWKQIKFSHGSSQMKSGKFMEYIKITNNTMQRKTYKNEYYLIQMMCVVCI